jgi:hypothetical protein
MNQVRLLSFLLLPALAVAATAPQHPRLYLTRERIARLWTEFASVRKTHWDMLRLLRLATRNVEMRSRNGRLLPAAVQRGRGRKI